MCGIVGLFLKKRELEPELGGMLAEMLAIMDDRGPDSAGFAVYGDAKPGRIKFSIRAPENFDFAILRSALNGTGLSDAGLEARATHAVVDAPAHKEQPLLTALSDLPELTVVGTGRRMEIFKEVGRPSDVAARFELASFAGSHGIGHTRMATESAVTTNGAHPFSTGPDQCLVHNGSLSNHNAMRRALQRHGIVFRTDNDTEVAAGYLSWRLREGDRLEQALASAIDALDGFYTFVVGTESGFGVLRDPIACKPAVMAETEDYVAFGSEYRALTGLPGISRAKVWEPEPARIYFWERQGELADA